MYNSRGMHVLLTHGYGLAVSVQQGQGAGWCGAPQLFWVGSPCPWGQPPDPITPRRGQIQFPGRV